MRATSGFYMILLSLLAGVLYFAYHQKWIVIQVPGNLTSKESCALTTSHKKNISIYYYDQGQIKSETTPIIVSDDKTTTLRQIVTNWLIVLDEAGCCSKKISLESVMLSASGTQAYLSFSRSLLDKKDSTHSNWMRLETLLKTIKQSNLNIAHICFMVHHQPMLDTHLDFSQPWPIHGFINQSR